MAAKAADIVLLALPNGKSHAFVQAAEGMAGDPLLVDISADHRFDSDWHYGLPELNRRDWSGGQRISNPGCYSTEIGRASGREGVSVTCGVTTARNQASVNV